MSLDNVIEKLGSFGRFQRNQYLMACYAAVCCSFATIILVYILNVPSHRCRLPQLGDADHWTINASLVASHVPLLESPEHCSNNALGLPACFQSCRLFSRVGNNTVGNATMACTDGYVYDRSEFIDTFPSEMDYVCDSGKEVLVTSLVQSQLIGVLIGALLSGILSDRYGRKPVLIGSMLLIGLAGLGNSLSFDPYSFWLCRFLVGMGVASTFTTSFVLGVEFIGPESRVHAGIVIEYAYASGLIGAVGVAYVLRYWRWLNIAVSVLPFFAILLIWLMEESPRWLISMGRIDQAEAVVRKAAVVNQVDLPDKLQLQPTEADKTTDQDEISSESGRASTMSTTTSTGSDQSSFLRVFTNRATGFMTLNVFLQWWVIALVYYGLSLSSGNLPGDIYVTSFLNALAEVIGSAIPHLLSNRLGRRATHVGSMLLSAIALGSTIFVELFGSSAGGGGSGSSSSSSSSLDWLLITLAMLGKVGITSAFCLVFLWTAEMFHTGVRQMAVGSASTSGRVGTLLAPFMADMKKFIPSSFGPALPLIIFGSLALLAGLLALLLPETLGIEMPETLEDCRRLALRRRRSPTNAVVPLTDDAINGSAIVAMNECPTTDASNADLSV